MIQNKAEPLKPRRAGQICHLQLGQLQNTAMVKPELHQHGHRHMADYHGPQMLTRQSMSSRVCKALQGSERCIPWGCSGNHVLHGAMVASSYLNLVDLVLQEDLGVIIL